MNRRESSASSTQTNAKKPTILHRQDMPRPNTGHLGRKFHAPRAPQGFTDDPPGFTTEKDPRGSGSTTFFNLPPATGNPPYRMDLASVLSADQIKQITSSGRMVFHSVGDTGGVNTTTYQQQVATFMELDIDPGIAGRPAPMFFYHLGDVVYYDGEIANYYWEFYEPYLHYPGPILAIPGNHDGDIDPIDQFNTPADSLKGFVRNFCAQAPIHLPEASDAPREAMTQPNVYWTLNTPLATIVGLYTNVPEGGIIGTDQLTWFEQELEAAPTDRALILALHHPVYSAYGAHPGSQYLKSVIENATKSAGRSPDLILTGHVHNYQRFTGSFNGKAIPTIVAGAGGYNQKLHQLKRPTFEPTRVPYKFADGPETLDKFNDFQHGYLILDVTKKRIVGSYIAVKDPSANEGVATEPLKPYDTFTIQL